MVDAIFAHSSLFLKHHQSFAIIVPQMGSLAVSETLSTMTTPFPSSRELFQVPTSSQNTPSSRSSTPAHLSMQPARWIGWRTGIKDRKMGKWNKDVENKAQADNEALGRVHEQDVYIYVYYIQAIFLHLSKCVRTVYRYIYIYIHTPLPHPLIPSSVYKITIYMDSSSSICFVHRENGNQRQDEEDEP